MSSRLPWSSSLYETFPLSSTVFYCHGRVSFHLPSYHLSLHSASLQLVLSFALFRCFIGLRSSPTVSLGIALRLGKIWQARLRLRPLVYFPLCEAWWRAMKRNILICFRFQSTTLNQLIPLLKSKHYKTFIEHEVRPEPLVNSIRSSRNVSYFL